MMKLLTLGFILFFISCNQTENKFKNSSFNKKIIIHRYLAPNWEDIHTLELDSKGLCYINPNNKSKNIEDVTIFNLLNNIDTVRVNELITCFDTVKESSGNEYLYKISIRNSTSIKNYDLGELYNTNCGNKMMDSLRTIFVNLRELY